MEQLDQLRERISKEGVDSGVQKLISSMMSLKVNYFFLTVNVSNLHYSACDLTNFQL